MGDLKIPLLENLLQHLKSCCRELKSIFALNEETRPPPPNTYTRFVPLNVRLSEPLRPLRESSKRAKFDKYCCFHRDRGHTTEDYFHLKQEIERLIRKGYLTKFVDKANNNRRDQRQRRGKNLPTVEVITIILGGPDSGDSSNARRTLLHATSKVNSYIPSSYPCEQVYQLQTSIEQLTFGESDLKGRREQHNDTLVISATLSNFWVKKILVDSGSSADIISIMRS
ncbi:hypothetical protein Pfo_019177 [Paulownia fortunei]|nr:hypothetical protein Pfo_019177 [Paulownia fortunei]